MMKLLKKTKDEQEIKIDQLQDIYYKNKDNEDAELEPLFLSLREQALDIISQRTVYNEQLTDITCEMERLSTEFREEVAYVEESMSKAYKFVGGKKKWNEYESIEMNLALGFSNWSEIDSFEKENKFVKRLRGFIYQQNLSALVYRSLTKLEKSKISTHFDISSRDLKALIVFNRTLEAM